MMFPEPNPYNLSSRVMHGTGTVSSVVPSRHLQKTPPSWSSQGMPAGTALDVQYVLSMPHATQFAAQVTPQYAFC